VNLATFERAQVAAFAYREARYTGSLECMKAICFVLRSRVKAGWGDGTWLSVMKSAAEVAGSNAWLLNQPGQAAEAYSKEFMAADDRLLQILIRDIDDIYLGQDRFDDSTRQVCCGDNPPKTSALYYSLVDRPTRDWFVENIVRKPEEHPHIANVGPVMLFR
jgi:hypothetical protein